MSIEFVRRIGKAEISTKHLNLTDINGKTYGAHFPPHKTKFIVIDQERARCASFSPRALWHNHTSIIDVKFFQNFISHFTRLNLNN